MQSTTERVRPYAPSRWCRCRTRDAPFEPTCSITFIPIGDQLDIWTTYGPYFAVAAAISLGAGALREALDKAAPANRLVSITAGLGHAATILVVIAFTLVGFFDWIIQYEDGAKTGNGIVIGICAIPGVFFSMAIVWSACDLYEKWRARRRSAQSIEDAQRTLRALMSWYASEEPGTPQREDLPGGK